jgi:hypothetical protein
MARNGKTREIHVREKVSSDKHQTMKTLLIINAISFGRSAKFGKFKFTRFITEFPRKFNN